VQECVSEADVVAPETTELECLLAEGARALIEDGNLLVSRERYEAAYLEAERIGDASAIAAAALGLGGLWVHEHRTAAGSTQVQARLRHALSLVDPSTSLALQLRVRLAGETDYRTGQHTAILAALDEARRAEDPMARAEALSLAHHCLLGPDHGALRRSLAAELIEESFRTGRRSDLLMGLLWQTIDLFLDADPRAERRLGELREMLSTEDHLAVGFVVSAIEVMLEIRAGRFERAEKLAQACAERGAAAGDVDAVGWYGGHLFAIRWYQGRIAELLPLLDELVHSPTLSVVDNSYFAALALAAARAGDRRTASGMLAKLCGPELELLPRSSTWLVTMSGIVEAANLLGEAEIAARVYALIRPYAHLPVVVSLGVADFGSAHHMLGVAALTMGELDLAVDHLREAVRANLAMTHWPAVVSARLRYAEALTARGRPEDVALARESREAAAEEATKLGLSFDDPIVEQSPRPLVCTRQGAQWRIDWAGRTALVVHSVGMVHLSTLTANPGTEIHAAALVAGVGALGDAARGSDQPVLDDAAMQEYRRRLSRLNAHIEELESTNQVDRAEAVRAERDWLLSELAGATGLGGRARRFPDDGERARIAVGKAIRRTLTHIEDADPAIAAHLRDTIRTGIRCAYRPE
jgi:tetratricopeptide (TPR) repeat protein